MSVDLKTVHEAFKLWQTQCGRICYHACTRKHNGSPHCRDTRSTLIQLFPQALLVPFCSKEARDNKFRNTLTKRSWFVKIRDTKLLTDKTLSFNFCHVFSSLVLTHWKTASFSERFYVNENNFIVTKFNNYHRTIVLFTTYKHTKQSSILNLSFSSPETLRFPTVHLWYRLSSIQLLVHRFYAFLKGYRIPPRIHHLWILEVLWAS